MNLSLDTLNLDPAVGTTASLLYIGAGLLLLAELAWLLCGRRLNRQRIKEMLASYSPFVPAAIVQSLTTATVLALYVAAYDLAPVRLPSSGWSVLAGVVLVDFVYYWEHRWSHQTRVLWALSHSVHHSSPDLNLSTAFRVSFVDELISPLFYLPLVLLGFHPALVFSGMMLNLAYQTWVHTEMIGKLGWLEGILNTPSNHRVHHATNARYLDKNFGAVLVIWDRLFGTYQAEDENEQPVYGLTTPLNSVNPLTVHFYEPLRLIRDVQGAGSLRVAWGFLFRHPAWEPREPMATAPTAGPAARG